MFKSLYARVKKKIKQEAPQWLSAIKTKTEDTVGMLKASRAFKLPGWQSALPAWEYCAAITAASISQNIPRMVLCCIFPCLAKNFDGISASQDFDQRKHSEGRMRA